MKPRFAWLLLIAAILIAVGAGERVRSTYWIWGFELCEPNANGSHALLIPLPRERHANQPVKWRPAGRLRCSIHTRNFRWLGGPTEVCVWSDDTGSIVMQSPVDGECRHWRHDVPEVLKSTELGSSEHCFLGTSRRLRADLVTRLVQRSEQDHRQSSESRRPAIVAGGTPASPAAPPFVPVQAKALQRIDLCQSAGRHRFAPLAVINKETASPKGRILVNVR